MYRGPGRDRPRDLGGPQRQDEDGAGAGAAGICEGGRRRSGAQKPWLGISKGRARPYSKAQRTVGAGCLSARPPCAEGRGGARGPGRAPAPPLARSPRVLGRRSWARERAADSWRAESAGSGRGGGSGLRSLAIPARSPSFCRAGTPQDCGGLGVPRRCGVVPGRATFWEVSPSDSHPPPYPHPRRLWRKLR